MYFHTIYIPLVDLAFIVVGSVIVTIYGKQQSENFYVLLIMDHLLYFAPIVDLVFYYLFLKKFSKISTSVWIWQ